MKIKLERKLTSCPEKLRCLVCDLVFEPNFHRALLYSDKGSIEGDICPHCLQLNAEQIKDYLREKALVLIARSSFSHVPSGLSYDRGLELLELSKENIKFPNFWQRLIHKIDIIAQESEELDEEMAIYDYQDRARLEKLFRDGNN